MKYSLSNTYVLKWELENNPNYKFTDDGICINIKTGNKIRMILNGRSKGYCINGKFKSLTSLRKELTKIKDVECPF